MGSEQVEVAEEAVDGGVLLVWGEVGAVLKGLFDAGDLFGVEARFGEAGVGGFGAGEFDGIDAGAGEGCFDGFGGGGAAAGGGVVGGDEGNVGVDR